MKKIFILLVILLVAVPLVLAQDGGSKVLTDEEGNTFMEFQEEITLCDDFMSQDGLIGSELPSFLPYKTEVFHIYYMDDSPLGFVELVDKKIVGADCEIQGEPTFIVYVKDDETVLNIINSEDPLSAYNQARSDDALSIKGVTFGKKVKGSFTNFAARVASWFI